MALNAPFDPTYLAYSFQLAPIACPLDGLSQLPRFDRIPAYR
jgi:hypothetical protein